MSNQLTQPQEYTIIDNIIDDVDKRLRLCGVTYVEKHPNKVVFSSDGKKFKIECTEVKG